MVIIVGYMWFGLNDRQACRFCTSSKTSSNKVTLHSLILFVDMRSTFPVEYLYN